MEIDDFIFNFKNYFQFLHHPTLGVKRTGNAQVEKHVSMENVITHVMLSNHVLKMLNVLYIAHYH